MVAVMVRAGEGMIPGTQREPQEWLLYTPAFSNDDSRFWPNGSARSPGLAVLDYLAR